MTLSTSLPRALPSPLQAAYQARLDDGDLQPDPAQRQALLMLQDFSNRLSNYRPASQGLLDRIGKLKRKPAALAGFYLYGDVGRGKSMLMDLFFSTANVAKKRRVHFHQFMLEIHERLHRLHDERNDNVLPSLAREIARATRLLCFDEFHVNNVADAMILGRLFSSLFSEGVIIVATSNWSPDELYKNGLQRERFLPFIDLIKQRMTVHRLTGDVDHRYQQIQGVPTYFHPLNEHTTRELQGIFLRLTDDATPEHLLLPVQGRVLRIVHAAKGVGFFNFDELCVAAMGAADYLAIAECLDTIILDGVPKLTADQRNETTRFMTLIDALYEAKVELFMGSAVDIEQLAPSGELAFAFQRTQSRLMEMQGEDYRAKPHLS